MIDKHKERINNRDELYTLLKQYNNKFKYERIGQLLYNICYSIRHDYDIFNLEDIEIINYIKKHL